ncbi:MAG: phenylacetic acid degradation protein PaaN [Cyclobacteriaceae bacterium]|nr:phenylacetic acid degradation protein PaaN [Cyclobacteriaceae bacterium]
MKLAATHIPTITRAIQAIHERTFFAQYPEHPSPKIYGEDADKNGRETFQNQVGKKFKELLQGDSDNWIGDEESPYLQEPLNITYPSCSAENLISNADVAFHQWRKVKADHRAAILVESLDRVKNRFFEIAYATMHTTGQGYMMAFQASGPHAADRALEAIAMGYEELTRFPESVIWDKPMGKYNLKLAKEWRAIPKGIGVVIGCSTFPTWNSVPGMYASLVTGNPVIIKPHPGAILPIAIFVAELQKVLKEEGLNPNICQLGVDSFSNMITKELAEDPRVKIIDYTGNSAFGNYLEGLKGKFVFTEKTGVNSAIIDSAEDIDKVIGNLAFSLSLYSGQMCTAPQNFYIPASGIKTPDGVVSFDEFAQKFADNIKVLVANLKAGPFVLGAIQNKNTCTRVDEFGSGTGKVWLTSGEVENPMFKNARTATPLVLEIDAQDKEEFSQELFGPIALLIKTEDTQQSVALAKEMALAHGAISCAAYTTNAETKEMIADEMSLAATPVSFNLTGGIYVNQHAGFSDFHVTGGNPAGNASFTNPEYVIKRFTWVGFREPVS